MTVLKPHTISRRNFNQENERGKTISAKPSVYNVSVFTILTRELHIDVLESRNVEY